MECARAAAPRDTARTLDTGENDNPAGRKRNSRASITETPESPTQQPTQDHRHAGSMKQDSGASVPLATLLLLNLSRITVVDDEGPGDAGLTLLSTQASQYEGGANLGPQHSLVQ